MTAVLELEPWGDGLARHCAANSHEASPRRTSSWTGPGSGKSCAPRKDRCSRAPRPASPKESPTISSIGFANSSTVMEAVRILADGEASPNAWMARFNEFVQFSLDLGKIDGKRFVEIVDFRTRTPPAFKQYLRSNTDIAEVRGQRVATATSATTPMARSISSYGTGRSTTALPCARWWRCGSKRTAWPWKTKPSCAWRS